MLCVLSLLYRAWNAPSSRATDPSTYGDAAVNGFAINGLLCARFAEECHCDRWLRAELPCASFNVYLLAGWMTSILPRKLLHHRANGRSPGPLPTEEMGPGWESFVQAKLPIS